MVIEDVDSLINYSRNSGRTTAAMNDAIEVANTGTRIRFVCSSTKQCSYARSMLKQAGSDPFLSPCDRPEFIEIITANQLDYECNVSIRQGIRTILDHHVWELMEDGKFRYLHEEIMKHGDFFELLLHPVGSPYENDADPTMCRMTDVYKEEWEKEIENEISELRVEDGQEDIIDAISDKFGIEISMNDTNKSVLSKMTRVMASTMENLEMAMREIFRMEKRIHELENDDS